MKKPLQYSTLSVCTYYGSGFILLMYVYRTFDIFDMRNKCLKSNLIYFACFLFLSTPSTWGISYSLAMLHEACSMNLQHL